MGKISDSAGRKVTSMICSLFLAGAILSLIYSKDLWMFYLFALIFGFSWGGLTTVTTAMIGDIFGGHRIGIIMGTFSAMWSLGASIGPFIGGFVFDMSNSYSVAFSVNIAAMIIATLFLALIKRETILDRRS